MKLLKNTLNILQDAQYLTAKTISSPSQSAHIRFEPLLLKNGVNFRENLLNIWQRTKVNEVYQCTKLEPNKFSQCEETNRLSFIQSEEFKQNYNEFCKLNKAISKPIEYRTVLNTIVSSMDNEEGLFKSQTNSRKSMTMLVSEYYIGMSDGLEKFYNIQRERKIWWMLYSANPSRFFIEPFDLSKTRTNEAFYQKCKSITIKAQFPYGIANMESITLVPLNVFSNFGCQQISVIRSIVNLDLTTSALILDGKEHTRGNTLLLNRKLAPFQMILSNLNKKDVITNKLILHLGSLIRESGLRLYSSPILKNCYKELDAELFYFDSLGIPYMLVVDKDSMKTGLMKLRSRDTTLYETIHISGIRSYLLNIFQ